MIPVAEFLLRVRVDRQILEAWLVSGWLIPQRQPDLLFSDVDVARGHLIRDLGDDFGVNDEGISLILHLLDQIHGLRRSMQELVEDVRRDRQHAGFDDKK
jgi:chaperone modulatory protein CbpM